MSDSIFKEVVFTPHIFEKDYLFQNHRNYFKLLAALKSLGKSGQVVGVYKDWLKLINENIKTFDESDKEEILSILIYLNDRQRVALNSKKSESIEEDIWIKQALQLNKIRIFDSIIAKSENDPIKTLLQVENDGFPYEGATVIPQTKENMKQLLAPILSYSEIVKIYDPYFKLFEEKYNKKSKKYSICFVDRYIDALNIICETSGFQYDKQENIIIEIHTSIKILFKNSNGKNYIFYELLEEYSKKILEFEQKYNHSISIHIWEDNNKDKWHDRWIVIPNKCAVVLGAGIDEKPWTDATWGLLNFEMIDSVGRKFIDNGYGYNLISTITKNGIKKNKNPLNYSEYKGKETIINTKSQNNENKVVPSSISGLRIVKKANKS